MPDRGEPNDPAREPETWLAGSIAVWLTQILDRNRRCFGMKLAIDDGRQSLSWKQLHDRVEATAGHLLGIGLRLGDRVVVIAENRVPVIGAYLALARIGATFVPVDPELTPDEVADIVRRVSATALIGEAARLDRLRGQQVPLLLDLDDWWSGLPVAAASGPRLAVRPDDIAAIMHTSATTGRPKGVVWDHRGLMQCSLSWLTLAEPAADMVFVNCLPLSHPGVAMCFTYMAAGAMIVLPSRLAAAEVLRAIERHRATHIWLVPGMLHELVTEAATSRYDVSGLREVIYGAAAMPGDLYRRAWGAFGCGFRQAYGMAEAGGHFAMLAPADHPQGLARQGSPDAFPVGRALPGTSVRICDEAGSDLPPGETGEVQVSSDSLMRGYWDDPRATAQMIRDGWLRTGDLGSMDDQGLIRLSGRLTDMIIRGGQNIYPAEIERVLRQHPGVSDAIVVGRPDPASGEVPVAYVIARAGARPVEDELRVLMRDELASYKWPVSIGFLDDHHLPLEKRRRMLRERAAQPDDLE